MFGQQQQRQLEYVVCGMQHLVVPASLLWYLKKRDRMIFWQTAAKTCVKKNSASSSGMVSDRGRSTSRCSICSSISKVGNASYSARMVLIEVEFIFLSHFLRQTSTSGYPVNSCYLSLSYLEDYSGIYLLFYALRTLREYLILFGHLSVACQSRTA